MITIHLITPAGETTTLQCQTGQSLMQAAIAANVAGIEADCGGLLTCATCHVVVQEPWVSQLPLPTADESGMLEFTASPCENGSRLSCQIQLTPELEGLLVKLPAAQH